MPSRSKHEIFRFKTITELKQAILDLGLDIPTSESFTSLNQPLTLGNLVCPNRLAIHPMEGCDGLRNGAPGPLTQRRYQRFGASGTGLIWFEATAIELDPQDPTKNPRANPRQLMLTDRNLKDFVNLREITEKEEEKLNRLHPAFGKSIKILQITHSGRYTRPGYNNPLRMYFYDPLDNAMGMNRNEGEILTDAYLDRLPAQYEHSIGLARDAGFDGVDIKICHRYLLSETLSAFTRAESKYGGESYQQRTALVKEIFKKIISNFASPHFVITTRYNMFDGIPYPYGWGVIKSHDSVPDPEHFRNVDIPPAPDLTEPIHLLKELYGMGVRLVNLTLANPYFNAFISRPFDTPVPGASLPPEHPLVGVARFLTLTRQIKAAIPPDMRIIATGYTWLRQYAPFVAAAEIQRGHTDMVGFGRMAFANPQFGQQIILQGGIDPNQSCITCSKCTEMMRKKTVTGCVIRDAATYMPYYKGEKKPDD